MTDDSRWGFGCPFRAQSMKARGDFKIGDAIRWTPDPLVVPFGPALEAQTDPCPRLCGTILDLDNLGQPFRVSVTAVEGDWTISPLGWRPKVGDVVVSWSIDRAGIIEYALTEDAPLTEFAELLLSLLYDFARNPFNDGSLVFSLPSICDATRLDVEPASEIAKALIEKGLAEEPSPGKFRITLRGMREAKDSE